MRFYTGNKAPKYKAFMGSIQAHKDGGICFLPTLIIAKDFEAAYERCRQMCNNNFPPSEGYHTQSWNIDVIENELVQLIKENC